MSDSVLQHLSTQMLLEIERACDRCEADFASGRTASIEDYLVEVNPAAHTRARQELVQLLQALSQSVLTQDATPGASDAHASPAVSSGAHPLDVRADRFELHQLLGSGGAGTVWKAFDRHLGRWVALKAPHIESLPDSQRFLSEARTVARLQHRHIGRVLDAGQDERGCFIVSEFIDGLTLSDKLKQARYEPRSAALLLSQIADALAYAHQAGIVHRDLKPQNILIDRSGQPFVVDFGLACEWFGPNSDRAKAGELQGTPAYMAPEQATGSSHRVEPRTDLYAMGVILFQLLTGELPFRGDVASVLHQLVHQEAPQAADISPNVPRELNTLCMLCLEKEPGRRLQSAEFLRDELTRFLQYQPIQSRPIHPLERIRKWAKRNPVVAITGSVAVCLALVTLVVSVGSLIFVSRAWEREHHLRISADAAKAEAIEASQKELLASQQAIEARHQAEQNSRLAQDEARLSQQSVQFLESILESSDPVHWVLQSGTGPVHEVPKLIDLLNTAAQRANIDLAGQPRIHARMLDTIANAYRGLGRFGDAARLLEQSQLLRNTLPSDSTNQVELQKEVIRNDFYRGMVHQDLGETSLAEEIYRRSLLKCEKLSQPDPLLVADIHFQLGWLLCSLRKQNEARTYFEQCLAIRTEYCPADSSSVKAAQVGLELSEARHMGQLSLDNLMTIVSGNDKYSRLVNEYLTVLACRQLGRLDEAILIYERLLTQLNEALPEHHPLAILAQGEYAELCWRQGQFRKALPAIEKTIAAAEIAAPQHAKLKAVREIFGYELLRAMRMREASHQFHKIIENDSPASITSSVALDGLVWVHLVDGESELAMPYAKRLLEITDPKSPYKMAWAHYAYARVLDRQGKSLESMQANETAFKLAKSVEPLPENPMWLERLTTIFASEDDLENAERTARRAVDIERATKPALHPHLADRLQTLVNILNRMNRTDEVATLQNEIHKIREASLPENDHRRMQGDGPR